MASYTFSDKNSGVSIKELLQERKKLKKTISLQEKELEIQDEEIDSMKKEINLRDEEIKDLKEIIEILQRKKYDSSSEKNKGGCCF